MPNGDIACLLKFAPKEVYIDGLMDGRLNMNEADYCHGLPGEQGDPLEASLAYGMGIYANWLLPICCTFTARESDIVDNAVVITRRMNDEFRCADDRIGIVRYDRFQRLLDWDIDSGDDISLRGSVLYGVPTPSPTFPRKFADVDWGSRKIIPNKICAECWPGAAFGPCWLLTERLRYETTPLLPALRDRVHVYGQRDDAHGSHCGNHAASGIRRAAGASRRQEQRHRQG